MSKIKVSELFWSCQGEGLFVGVPSIFLRTFGCNFTCSGFGMPRGAKSQERFNVDPNQYKSFSELPLLQTGCDSAYSWDPRFKDFSPLMDVPSIVDQIVSLLPNGTFSKDKHLIITGGEPLLGWQRSYPYLLDEIQNREMGLTDITFETNGTQFVSEELAYHLTNLHYIKKVTTTFSVSAKLPCSGEKWEDAIKPDRIFQYQNLPGSNVYLKFVVATEEDVKDVHQAVQEYRDSGFSGSVYLMPVGGVDTVYFLNNKTVAELAMKNGYRYSPRMQVDLWKNRWAS